jgi:hypothetical protein
MSKEAPSSSSGANNQIRSGPEIVADFVTALKSDPQLDKSTVEAIENLFQNKRLSQTNLLKLLEEARGKRAYDSPADNPDRWLPRRP